jgi:hypothetical protein
VGGNQLAREYTGRSIVTRVQEIPQTWGRARHNDEVRGKDIMREKLRAEKVGDGKGKMGGNVLEELQRQKQEASDISAQKATWKVERDRKEKEAMEEGKGYGDLITEQIWEVWNWGKGRAEGLKEKDEEVVQREGKEGKD